MDYLEDTLRLKVEYREWTEAAKLPLLLASRYRFRQAILSGTRTIFVYPDGEMEPVSAVGKHLALVSCMAASPAVLVLEGCTSRQRRAMIEKGIAFVVRDRQVYLPFMGVVLQDVFTSPQEKRALLLPSAQLLLFFFIYSGKSELAMASLPGRLGLSAMSVSRAARQLESLDLIRTRRAGAGKAITTDCCGRELYQKAGSFLRSPVREVMYAEKGAAAGLGVRAGLSALSERTMLSPPAVQTIAVRKVPEGIGLTEKTLTDADAQCRIERWTYSPSALAENGCADVLSLCLSLQSDTDERVQAELDSMLAGFWEGLRGG